MKTVSQFAKTVKQNGGFLPKKMMAIEQFNDRITLHREENVSPNIIGLVVDYATRFTKTRDKTEIFHVALEGTERAEQHGRKGSRLLVVNLINGLHMHDLENLSDKTVDSLCKIVTFDIWKRDELTAMNYPNLHETVKPDRDTCENIRTMVRRSVRFFESQGGIKVADFTFEPEEKDRNKYVEMLRTQIGTYGGYTPIVSSGDGDFLTNDTLYDMKVMKQEASTQHTLQILVYYLMGKESGQSIFNNITHIGIFNPRLNKVYTYDMRNYRN